MATMYVAGESLQAGDMVRVDERGHVVKMRDGDNATSRRTTVVRLRPDVSDRHKVHAYEQLERVRNVLSNAEASPLFDDEAQRRALELLRELRGIYRHAWDGGK